MYAQFRLRGKAGQVEWGAAMTTSGITRGAVLLLRYRGGSCALPIGHVVEIMRPQPVEPLVGAPRFVLGVSLIRGGPVPVVDVASLLDGGPPGGAARFVLVRAGERRVALAAEAVPGVVDLPAEDFPALPPLLGTAPGGQIDRIGALDAQLCMVLSVGRVVPDDVWTAMQRPAVSRVGPR